MDVPSDRTKIPRNPCNGDPLSNNFRLITFSARKEKSQTYSAMKSLDFIHPNSLAFIVPMRDDRTDKRFSH